MEDSDVVVVSVLDLVDVSESVAVLDPIVVGSDRDVAVAVRSKDKLLRSKEDIPDAVMTTVVPRSDESPQPYWKKPPSKLFL